MKNIVCPISNERIPEHLPRVTAFYVLLIFILYLVSGNLLLVVFLAFDFLLRGFNRSKFSVINQVAKQTSKALSLQSPFIDKAPKIFAARLGGAIAVLIILLHLLDLHIGAKSLALTVSFLATLECVLNLCVGCYIYNWFVLPLFVRK